MVAARRAGPGLGEVLALWALYAGELVVILVAASRRPVVEEQREARLRADRAWQTMSFVRHPLAVAAVPLGGLAAMRLGRERRGKAAWRSATPVAMVVTLLTARPKARRKRQDGVAIVASGVVAWAALLTMAAVRESGVGGVAPWNRVDRLRLAVALGVGVLALPWILADGNVYVGDIPAFGRIFLSRQRVPAGARGPAVHLGHHHGMDGALLVWTGLALSRQLEAVADERERSALSFGLAGLIAYGLARLIEDGWYEQIVKRGWTTARVPRLVVNGRFASPKGWVGLLLATGVGGWTLQQRSHGPGREAVPTLAAESHGYEIASDGSDRSSPKKWRRAASSGMRPSGPKA